MEQICNINSCTGCGACSNICPKKCISMAEDKFGFLYPNINNDSCIDCGLCKKICPANADVQFNDPKNVYAAINKSDVDYATSTSGGIATLFSRNIIEKNGVVYGAGFLDGFRVKHLRCETQADVEKIKGSKYVQSITVDMLDALKKDLEDGRNVLFVGTPCQVAGVKSYVKKDYPNLILCDLVCHGVPSSKMLKEHLSGINDIDKAEKVSFRDKQGFYLSVFDKDGVIYRKRNFKDVFYLGFLKSLLYRECCYSCKYAKSQRVSDITLGDFWGFDSEKGKFPSSTSNGLSLVMVNTEKGNGFFEECKDKMIFVQRTAQEAVAGNKQLRFPSVKHRNRNKFVSRYLSKGFKKAAGSALWKERIIYGILDMIGK